LADCFLELIKMAQAISQISFIQNSDFKNKCIAIFNKRWKQFNTEVYLLAFFLHPKYRGKNIKNIIYLLYDNFYLMEFYNINF